MGKSKKIITVSLFFFIIFFIVLYNILKNDITYIFNIICKYGESYFGIFFLPVIIILILDFLFIFIHKKNIKILCRTRLIFYILSIMTLTSVFVLYYLQISSMLNENNIIKFGLFEHNLGFLMTYFITVIYNLFELNQIYIGAGGILLISFFFLFGREIGMIVRYFIKLSNKRKAKKLQRILFSQTSQEIKRKQEVERKKSLEYDKEKIKFENMVKEKLEKAIKNNSLPLSQEENKKNN